MIRGLHSKACLSCSSAWCLTPLFQCRCMLGQSVLLILFPTIERGSFQGVACSSCGRPFKYVLQAVLIYQPVVQDEDYDMTEGVPSRLIIQVQLGPLHSWCCINIKTTQQTPQSRDCMISRATSVYGLSIRWVKLNCLQSVSSLIPFLKTTFCPHILPEE